MMRATATIALSTLAVVAAMDAGAAIYRCDDNGKVVYQAEPCRSAGRTIDLSHAPVPAGAAEKGLQELERLRGAVAAQERARVASENAAEAARLDREVRRLDLERDRELAALQSRLDYTVYNTPGAPWERGWAEQALRAEMKAVAERYDARKQQARDRLAQLGGAPAPPPTPPATTPAR